MRHLFVYLSIFLGIGFFSDKALADMWACEQLDGSYLFTDRGTADCQIIERDEDKGGLKNVPYGRQAVKEPVPVPAIGSAGTLQPSASLLKAPAEFPPSVQRFP